MPRWSPPNARRPAHARWPDGLNLAMLLWLCALHSLAFALFHLAFWKLFGWPGSLASTTPANRAVIQILNLRLTWVFLCVATALWWLPQEIAGTRLGRGLLAAMCLFWVGRTIEQFVFLRVNQRLVHVLTALFAVGAGLFGWAFALAVQAQA